MAVPDYFNRVNPDLLRAIPADAQVVLEVGCGAGATAEHYLRYNPAAEYVGVERDEAAAEVARTRLGRVVVGDIDSMDVAAIGLERGSVDALVFGDVLEHMTDPWGVLKRLATLLKPGGQAVASIPNVQHWSVILGLLRGQWQYEDEGLLDRTHLRFFAAEGLAPLFAGAGLLVHDVKPRTFAHADFERFQAALAPSLQALGVDPTVFRLRSEALQYIVRAVKSEAPPRKIAIQTLIAEPLVCARVRVLEPDLLLGTIPGVRTVASTAPESLGPILPGEEPILVRQRNVLMDAAESLRGQAGLIRSGYLVVQEFDDDPAHFPAVGQHRHLTFSACHAVQVSTEALAEIIRPHNPNVRAFRNEIAVLPPLRTPRESGPLTLFFGALNREADWADLMEPLNRVLAARGDSVRVKVVHDWGFYDALDTEHKQFEKFCAYDKYIEHLRASDIAILPLKPTRFNACKSDLKFIECAAHGVAALASPTAYSATLRDGETGVLFDSPEGFEEKLNRLLDDADWRARIAQNAHHYVADERMLADHFRDRYDWYCDLRGRLPELNRQLIARVPEMFG